MSLARSHRVPSVVQRIVGLVVGLSVVELVVLHSFGIWPTSPRGWILLLVLGPLAYLLAEWVSNGLLTRVEKFGGGSASLLSWRRVLVARCFSVADFTRCSALVGSGCRPWNVTSADVACL